MKTEALKIEHQKDKNRFVMDVEGQIAKVDYRHRDGKLWLVHSEVPLQLRGQGYGKILIQKTLEKLTEEGYEAVAVCPFISKVVSRSPQWNEVVDYQL